MKITLPYSKQVVELKDRLGWYDSQELQILSSESLKGVNLDSETAKKIKDGTIDESDALVYLKQMDMWKNLEFRMALAEKIIESIKDGDKEITYSEDWLKNLVEEDGDKIIEAAQKIFAKKKKTKKE